MRMTRNRFELLIFQELYLQLAIKNLVQERLRHTLRHEYDNCKNHKQVTPLSEWANYADGTDGMRTGGDTNATKESLVMLANSMM